MNDQLTNEFSYHSTSVEETSRHLRTDIEKGLSTAEANGRLDKIGPNAIPEGEVISSFRILLNQFINPIVFLLLFAAALSFWFKEWLDGIAILIVLFINAAIGFYMEYKAHQSVLALKKLSSIPAKVMRDGALHEINATDIVPGDILYAEAGDIIPADGQITHSTQLLIDESALTGESVTVEKKEAVLPEETVLGDRVNMVYKSTYVSKGHAHIMVCATGVQTELGKIATLVQSSKQAATPLEKKLNAFSKMLIKITIGIAIVIFAIGLLQGGNIVDMLQTVIALAVAAIPEGLPIVATMTLAQGMMKMARYKVIVKKLSAVETLGGTNVICTDKTGTLTQNKIEVVLLDGPLAKWNKEDKEVAVNKQSTLNLKCAILCNTAEINTTEDKTEEIGDPLETALLRFAKVHGEDIEKVRSAYLKKDEEPFSSETKIMATLHEHEGRLFIFAKGAPEELLQKCNRILAEQDEKLDENKRQQWLTIADDYAASGHRVVAMAYSKPAQTPETLTDDLIFIGFIGMIDPPREDVADAIAACKTAGIKVVMITGDHPATAQFIGKQLGILSESDNAVIGKDMKEFEALSEEEKLQWIDTSVFARVNPKHKLDLVKVFQEKGFVVGMTGDGVNDAPALKKADIGIAMGIMGTQVAQEVSDMVLKDDSFSSIVVAIKEGRIIFENIKKFVVFMLSCNLSELIVIGAAAIVMPQVQLLPLQILFINLITDVLPALALGVSKGSDEVMQKHPAASAEPIVDSWRWKRIFMYAIVMAMASFGAVLFNQYVNHAGVATDSSASNNMIFYTLIICQLLHVFNMGSRPFFNNEVIKNKFVWLAVSGSLVILFAIIQIPFVSDALNIVHISMVEWIIIMSAAVASVVVIQGLKWLSLFNPKK